MAQSSDTPFSGIFVCYRRDDSSGHAGRLFDKLVDHFGKDQIFMDIEMIEPGRDFVTVIENIVGSCDILIALIGRHWLSRAGETSCLLDNPDDFVRLEIGIALERNVSIVPVLVRGAIMPKPKDLPDSISALSRRNAFELSDIRWHHDVGQLIRILERIIAERYESQRRGGDEEQRQRKEIEEKRQVVEDRLRTLAESRRRAQEELERLKQEADLRVEQEHQLNLTLSVLREQEEATTKRIEEIHGRLAAQVQACYVAEAELRELAEKESQVNADADALQKRKEEAVERQRELEAEALRLAREERRG